MLKKRKIWLLILIAVIFGQLRETGCINLQTTDSTIEESTEIYIESEFYQNDGQFTIDETSLKNTSKEDIKAWEIGFQTAPKTNIMTDLTAIVRNRLSTEEWISVDVLNVELSGLYWLPFYKTGSCKYELSFKAAGKKGQSYNGELRGNLEFTIVGFSSIAKAREAIGDKLVKVVTKDLRKQLK